MIGSKTALKIEIEPGAGSTEIKEGIGIFGLQAVPTAISAFLFWSIIVTQIAGMVQQANLDDEAIAVAEDSLRAQAASTMTIATGPSNQRFCVNCGAGDPLNASFCTACGTRLPQANSGSQEANPANNSAA